MGNSSSKEQEVLLPKPKLKGNISLEEAIYKRRSHRRFLPKDLTIEQIGQLLWVAQGITDEAQNLRAAPSAGALYPMEIYLVKSDGLFHYSVKGHKLTSISKDDLRKQLQAAALFQGFVSQAPVDIIICAVYERVTGKYGRRGIQYVHMEAGHAAQNIHLQAVAEGLGSVSVGAFNSNDVKKALNLPADQEPLYIIPVGYVK